MKSNKVKASIKPQKKIQSNSNYSIWIWVIMGITFLVYLPSLTNEFTNWDDDQYLTENIAYLQLNGTNFKLWFTDYFVGNYHPLTMLVYSLVFQFFGLESWAFHTFSLLFHLINIYLVFRLVIQLFSHFEIGLFVAALFALHPMHTESVAWISELKDVLYAMFYMATLISYQNFLKNKDSKQLLFSLILFVLSCLSKPMAVSIPLVLILLHVFTTSEKLSIRTFIPIGIFAFISLVFSYIAILSQSSGGAVHNLAMEFSVLDRFFLVFHSFFYYCYQFIFPIGLSAFHDYPLKTTGFLPWYVYGSFMGSILLFTAIYKMKTFSRESVFGFLFFIVALLPVLQIVPVGQIMVAERYTYVPYIGLSIALLFPLYKKIQNKKNLNMVLMGLVAVFSVMTFVRTKVWKNNETLWTDVIQKDANNPLAYINRSKYYLQNNKQTMALADLEKASNISPNMPEVWNSMGMTKYQMNDASCLQDFDKAIQLQPDFAIAYNNRANAYEKVGNIQNAIADYQKAITLMPERSDFVYNLALMYSKTQKYTDALNLYSKAIEINPEFAAAYTNRGIVYQLLGNQNNACEDWKKAANLGNAKATEKLSQFCK